MPGAGLFFCTYETTKPILERNISNAVYAQMLAASVAETMACLVRVPTEVVKQRMQTGMEKSALEAVPKIIRAEGIGGIYSGFGVTVMREIPFSMIQFPIYEKLKDVWSDMQGSRVAPWQSAACGSVAGGVAAAATTPLDVIKTRLMLGADAQGVPYNGALDVYSKVVKNEGYATLFSGVQPRVMWIGIGGFVFFGAYEAAKSQLLNVVR
jgi:solute carrier family 25 S-adenosylmethionine transporter 26